MKNFGDSSGPRRGRQFGDSPAAARAKGGARPERSPAQPAAGGPRPKGQPPVRTAAPARYVKPAMGIFTTTLWEYPSQHYNGSTSAMQGDSRYVGATPSWVIWQVLSRYTVEGEKVLDPMCGSGTTVDVCTDLRRVGLGMDLVPRRADIKQGDARKIPLAAASVDCVFIDPPYSTHVDYSDDPRCIGKLNAGGDDGGAAYYESMTRVLDECYRVLRPGRHLALYVSDSFKKKPSGRNEFMPIGFELFSIMRRKFMPMDIISVVRQNQKLGKGNWHKAAEEQNFFLRGFNYLFIMKKA